MFLNELNDEMNIQRGSEMNESLRYYLENFEIRDMYCEAYGICESDYEDDDDDDEDEYDEDDEKECKKKGKKCKKGKDDDDDEYDEDDIDNGADPEDLMEEINELHFDIGESPEALLKVYKWIWGQEDVNYPGKKGRFYSWESLAQLRDTL